jgi:hypothetical protein
MKQILIEKFLEPSEIKILGDFVREFWIDKYGDLHSFMNHPSYISHKSGKIITKLWHKKGFRHRDRNLPNTITFDYSYHTTITEFWRDINGTVLKAKTYKINKY